MDIKASLEGCIVALGGMQLRVDQAQQCEIVKAVIRTLDAVRGEIAKQEKEAPADGEDQNQ